MKATVCMPWRPQPDRLAPHRRCVEFWTNAGFAVVEGDSDPAQPFASNVARNAAVRKAGTDIVVIADADTLPEDIGQIHRGISAVGEDDTAEICYPHTVYRYIPPEWTDRDDLSRAPILNEAFHSPGGIVIARQDAFWAIGGFDERFTPGRLGFDDTAFMLAAQTLTRWWRIFGTIWSFDHPDSADRTYDESHPNHARYQLYEFARDDPKVMAALVTGNSTGPG